LHIQQQREPTSRGLVAIFVDSKLGHQKLRA
jgi:hypothetical protein